jgi:N-acetylmuramoyl-L-alanine amidase
MSYSVRQNPAYIGNYTKGRAGAKINKIVIHHAATTSFDGIGRTFKSVGRMASAHYGVGREKNVDQYVDEADMAWHAGTLNPATNPNPTSIGIETVNSTGAPEWKHAEQTFETLVELVRDIAKRHGLLPLKVGVNLFQHSDFASTFCAGKMGDRLHELAENGATIQSVQIDFARLAMTRMLFKRWSIKSLVLAAESPAAHRLRVDQ